MQKNAPNPLSGLMRKSKLKINLPGGGKYWDKSSIVLNDDNEYSVFSITARDELNLKNPALLAEGEAIVRTIQSCIPDIKDAWKTPGIDIDALMIAIRIASEGNILKISEAINGQKFTFEVNLTDILNEVINNAIWEEKFALGDDFTVYLNPPKFKTITLLGREAIETQRIMNIVNAEEDEELKINKFKKSFLKLTDIALALVLDCIYAIDVEGQTVDNKTHIKEFVENCDSDIFTKIKERIDVLIEGYSIKPLKIKATEEMIEAGCEEELEIDISAHISKFFTGEIQ